MAGTSSRTVVFMNSCDPEASVDVMSRPILTATLDQELSHGATLSLETSHA